MLQNAAVAEGLPYWCPTENISQYIYIYILVKVGSQHHRILNRKCTSVSLACFFETTGIRREPHLSFALIDRSMAF